MTDGRLRRIVLTAIGVTILSMPLGARAAGVEEFYRGRSLSLIIGYSAGSGYDLYARLLGRFIGKYIPGNPAVIPQNMPGAGSLKAAMYLYSVAPKDGTVIATIGRSAPLEPLLGEAQFDGRNFAWLGSIASNSSLCTTWHTSAVKTWQDALTKPFALAGEGSAGRLVLIAGFPERMTPRADSPDVLVNPSFRQFILKSVAWLARASAVSSS